MQKKVNLRVRGFGVFGALLLTACVHAAAPPAVDSPACERGWRLVAEHPHDSTHFTQGLLLTQGRLFESTGGYGASAIHEVDLRTGLSLRSYRLPAQAFGEGLARVGDRLVQLTWREQLAVVYDLELNALGTVPYVGEGWGLTTLPGADGERLVLSDGSAVLRLLDPETLKHAGRIEVRDGARPVAQLNELEWVGREILANIWHSDRVAAIDPANGRVRGWFDFSLLRKHLRWPSGIAPAESVLNGLAFDERSGRLLVTGKLWPKLFEIEIGGCAAADLAP